MKQNEKRREWVLLKEWDVIGIQFGIAAESLASIRISKEPNGKEEPCLTGLVLKGTSIMVRDFRDVSARWEAVKDQAKNLGKKQHRYVEAFAGYQDDKDEKSLEWLHITERRYFPLLAAANEALGITEEPQAVSAALWRDERSNFILVVGECGQDEVPTIGMQAVDVPFITESVDIDFDDSKDNGCVWRHIDNFRKVVNIIGTSGVSGNKGGKGSGGQIKIIQKSRGEKGLRVGLRTGETIVVSRGGMTQIETSAVREVVSIDRQENRQRSYIDDRSAKQHGQVAVGQEIVVKGLVEVVRTPIVVTWKVVAATAVDMRQPAVSASQSQTKKSERHSKKRGDEGPLTGTQMADALAVIKAKAEEPETAKDESAAEPEQGTTEAGVETPPEIPEGDSDDLPDDILGDGESDEAAEEPQAEAEPEAVEDEVANLRVSCADAELASRGKGKQGKKRDRGRAEVEEATEEVRPRQNARRQKGGKAARGGKSK